MAIEKHPICDTDLWVDLSCINELEFVFALSFGAYISDAVKYELQNLKERDADQFGHAFKNYQVYKDEQKLFRIDLNSNKYFTDDDRKAVKRKFAELRIPYCFDKGCYTEPKKNMGETVSVVFAGILELPVILSNDNETPSIIRQHYNWLDAYNIRKLMETLGKSESEIQNVYGKVKKRKNEFVEENPLLAWKKKYCM